MKKLFLKVLLVAVLGLILGATQTAMAQGQYTVGYGSGTLSNANSTAAITMGLYQDPTNNWSATYGPLRQKAITLQFKFMESAATSTSYILYYQRSVDGVNYESTLQPAGFTVAALTSVQHTNLDLNGCGYIKFAYLTNASGSINGTNITYSFPLNYNAVKY